MKKATGIFVPFGSEYKELTDSIENKSFNDICEQLGYKPNQTYSLMSLGVSNYTGEIEWVFFEIFTDKIIFIKTKDTIAELSVEMINEFINTVACWSKKSAFDILTEGIEQGNLSIEFLSRVLEINDPKPNGTYLIEKIGYILYFSKGFLVNIKSSDGLNQWAKKEQEENPEYFENCKLYAKRFLTNSDEIIHELNTQAEAAVNIPINEDFKKNTELHRNSFGTINWYNLLICHHGKKVILDDFLQINKGRYEELNSNSDIRRFRVNNFIYKFSGSELLNTKKIDDRNNINQGYIYVLINQSLKGLVKIGKTKRNPDDRAKELSTATGVPSPFFVAYKIFVSDCDKAENYIHNILSSKGIRVSENREFFKISLDEIIKIMVTTKSIFHLSSVDF